MRIPMGGHKKPTQTRLNTLNNSISTSTHSQQSMMSTNSSNQSDANSTHLKPAEESQHFNALSARVQQDIREKKNNIYSMTNNSQLNYPSGRYIDVLSNPSVLNTT